MPTCLPLRRPPTGRHVRDLMLFRCCCWLYALSSPGRVVLSLFFVVYVLVVICIFLFFCFVCLVVGEVYLLFLRSPPLTFCRFAPISWVLLIYVSGLSLNLVVTPVLWLLADEHKRRNGTLLFDSVRLSPIIVWREQRERRERQGGARWQHTHLAISLTPSPYIPRR